MKPWHRDSDGPARLEVTKRIIEHAAAIHEGTTVSSAVWQAALPSVVVRLEDTLYCHASSLAEYSERRTLAARLKAALEVVIGRTEDDDRCYLAHGRWGPAPASAARGGAAPPAPPPKVPPAEQGERRLLLPCIEASLALFPQAKPISPASGPHSTLSRRTLRQIAPGDRPTTPRIPAPAARAAHGSGGKRQTAARPRATGARGGMAKRHSPGVQTVCSSGSAPSMPGKPHHLPIAPASFAPVRPVFPPQGITVPALPALPTIPAPSSFAYTPLSVVEPPGPHAQPVVAPPVLLPRPPAAAALMPPVYGHAHGANSHAAVSGMLSAPSQTLGRDGVWVAPPAAAVPPSGRGQESPEARSLALQGAPAAGGSALSALKRRLPDDAALQSPSFLSPAATAPSALLPCAERHASAVRASASGRPACSSGEPSPRTGVASPGVAVPRSMQSLSPQLAQSLSPWHTPSQSPRFIQSQAQPLRFHMDQAVSTLPSGATQDGSEASSRAHPPHPAGPAPSLIDHVMRLLPRPSALQPPASVATRDVAGIGSAYSGSAVGAEAAPVGGSVAGHSIEAIQLALQQHFYATAASARTLPPPYEVHTQTPPFSLQARDLCTEGRSLGRAVRGIGVSAPDQASPSNSAFPISMPFQETAAAIDIQNRTSRHPEADRVHLRDGMSFPNSSAEAQGVVKRRRIEDRSNEEYGRSSPEVPRLFGVPLRGDGYRKDQIG